MVLGEAGLGVYKFGFFPTEHNAVLLNVTNEVKKKLYDAKTTNKAFGVFFKYILWIEFTMYYW